MASRLEIDLSRTPKDHESTSDKTTKSAMTFLIYMHTSPSGKSYIGQTNNYPKRSKEHRLGCGCTAFSKAIRKYGWSAFDHKVLIDGLTSEEANRMEIHLIASLGTIAPNGYNLRAGGENGLQCAETEARMSIAQKGRKASDEARRKMSIAKTGARLSISHRESMSNAQKGRVFDAQTKNKISESLMGHEVSEITRMRISISKKNPSDETRAKLSKIRKGKPHSAETKARISSAQQGRKHSEETKKKMAESAKIREAAKKKTAQCGLFDAPTC